MDSFFAVIFILKIHDYVWKHKDFLPVILPSLELAVNVLFDCSKKFTRKKGIMYMNNKRLVSAMLSFVLTVGLIPASLLPTVLAEADANATVTGNTYSTVTGDTYNTVTESTYSFLNETLTPNLPRVEQVRFKAKQGQVTVTSTTYDQKDEQQYVISNTAGEVIEEGLLNGGESKQFNLPADGEYFLSQHYSFKPASYTGARGLDLKAQGLEVADATVPKLEIGGFTPFEVKNSSFQITLTPKSNIAKVSVAIDGELVKEDDTSISPVTVDPADMTEGLHTVNVQATSEKGNKMEIISLFMVDHENAFTDVTINHWAHNQVEAMEAALIIDGRSDGVFDPEGKVTREEFAKMLALSLQLEIDEDAAVPFADMKTGDWSVPYVAALKAAGLVEGNEVGGRTVFHPTDKITRAEVVTMLGRTKAFSAMPETGGATFIDIDQIPNYAKAGVAKLSVAKWVDGYEDGNFAPLKDLTRAEAAKILSYFLGM